MMGVAFITIPTVRSLNKKQETFLQMGETKTCLVSSLKCSWFQYCFTFSKNPKCTLQMV